MVTDRVRASLSLSQLETEGINAREIDSVNPDRDGYENTTAHGALTVQLNDMIALDFAATDISGENEYDGCYDTLTFALIHDCDDDYEQRAWRAGATLTSDQHSLALAVSSKRDRARLLFGRAALLCDNGRDGFGLAIRSMARL